MNRQRKIIICDDDKIDIKLFKKFIGVEKLKVCNILEAGNADELYKLIKDNADSIDLIFLDYYLGEHNGLDILKKLRRSNKIPVIMLTGSGDEETAVECMKEGAMDYIPKDTLSKIDIMKTVQHAIDKWELERERDLLLGIAAHELRNPLAVILGYTEMLKTYYDLDQKTKNEFIDIIQERSNHLLDIINELLDITRIDKGIIVLKITKCDLVPLLQKQVNDSYFQASKKNITISLKTQLSKLEIEIDPNRIEEVLSNLIDNAVKYSPQKTKVIVSLEQLEEKVKICVKDEGLGIKENELKYLFKLFSSKNISTLPTGKESRTGLGLAICKKVIDAHNGEIIVESTVGKGTQFSILLPL